MSIISAIYTTYLMKNGLNLLEVNLVNALFYLSLFICEIPTGAFADIFGRKTSFVMACALMCVSMFVYGSSHTFVGFITAEIISAVGYTFRSGAFQAWLVDSLKHQGYEGEFNRIFGRESLIRQIGGGIGAVVGSYLAVRNPSLPWFVGGTVMGITMIVACCVMKEDYFVHEIFSWKKGFTSMKNVAVSSIRYGMKDKAVRFILIITCVQIFSVQAINMYWQPFFKNHSVSEQHLGFLFIGMMVALAIGAFIASRFKSSGKEKRIILQAQITTGILIIMTALISGLPFIILLFLIHEVSRGFWGPMMDSYLHKRIPSDERATITSFCAIAPHIGGAAGLLASGIIAQYFSISVAWIVSGITLIVSVLLITQNGRKTSN